MNSSLVTSRPDAWLNLLWNPYFVFSSKNSSSEVVHIYKIKQYCAKFAHPRSKVKKVFVLQAIHLNSSLSELEL